MLPLYFGQIIPKTLVIKTEAYGPQIRGGESSCAVRVAAEEILSSGDAVDVLVVFRWADYDRFRGEICVSPDALVLRL